MFAGNLSPPVHPQPSAVSLQRPSFLRPREQPFQGVQLSKGLASVYREPDGVSKKWCLWGGKLVGQKGCHYQHSHSTWSKSKQSGGTNIDIESLQNWLLKVCYVPATSAGLPRVSFFFSFLLLQPLTVIMKQARQAVHAVKESIFLDVYGN